MKKLFAIFLLLLLAGCTGPKVELQEVTNESIITEIPEIVVGEEQDTAPYYNLTEGETKEILGSTITLTDIQSGPRIDMVVDGKELSIENTKSEELSGDLSILIQNVIYFYDEQHKQQRRVILKIEQFQLAENEYILQRGQRTSIGNKDIILEESKADGSIKVTVNDKGRNTGESETIKHSETVYIYGMTITNVKNYYKTNQYTLISVE